MEFEWIPRKVYVISAIYRPRDAEPYRNFMFSELRDEELWMHVEYDIDAAHRTLHLLQESAKRLEQQHYQWPDQVIEIDDTQLMAMAREAPTRLPRVPGYVHHFREVQWPKGRANFVYWGDVIDRPHPMFG